MSMCNIAGSRTKNSEIRNRRVLIGILITILLLLSIMLLGAVRANAAERFAWAEVVGGGNRYFDTSISKLNSYMSDNKEKTINIHMFKNWNAAENGGEIFDETLVIPSKTKVTLYMHGYVFNRNNAWRDTTAVDGEVIRVETDATLTIEGGTRYESSQEHKNVAVYTSSTKGSKATGRITVNGACITGGVCTKGGGGIYAKSGTTVTVNNTTIAGCCSRQGYIYDNGYGGGVWMYDDNATLRMNNSRVTGCMADDEGGGICIENDDTINIELNNTSIDNNYATDKGGGIYVGGEKCHINGYEGAEIKNNKAGNQGGGIYLQDIEESASGVHISGNKATDGGGIYVEDTEVSLSDLEVKNNNAGERGGGIYIRNTEDTISACEVTGNNAGLSGGGIYVYKNVKTGFAVKGKMIVRDNTCVHPVGKNFYISDSDPEDSRVNFNLTKGADVRFSYYDTKNKDYLMVTEGKAGDQKKTPNCIQFLKPENSGYHFTFNSQPNQRKIYYVKNGKDSSASGDPEVQPKAKTSVSAKNAVNMPGQQGDGDTVAGIVGKVGPGGDTDGNAYDLIRGFTRHQSTDSDTEDTVCTFYYSDGFFDSDPKDYNDHLATTSLAMAYSGMYLRAKETEDENGNYYYNRHAAGRQFLADIGCPDQNIYVNDSNVSQPQSDSIGVTIGSKELKKANGDKTGNILVPVVVRGGGYEREWASNATLGEASKTDGKQAQGFSEAASQVLTEVEKYLDKYELRDEISRGKVRFWVTGYSRAGATANITSKKLVEKYASGSGEGDNNQVFGYTCEAPMGGTDDAEELNDKTKYYCIHNLINAVDIVPLVAPQLMGFKRYGVDHYIPGTSAGNIRTSKVNTFRRNGNGKDGPDWATTYQDNDTVLIKSGAMTSDLKKRMISQLRSVDSDIVFDDYFHPMSMDFAPSTKFYEVGSYDNNHSEEFIKDVIRYAQEGLHPDQNNAKTQTIPNRYYFVQNIQQALRDTLALVFTMGPEQSSGFIGRASSVMDKFDKADKLEIYLNIIVDWDVRTPSEKKVYYTRFWKKLDETGAFEFLDPSDVTKLESNWPSLADFLFTFVNADHQYKPGPISSWAGGADKKSMLLGTFTTYANYILQNHYPEINLAWERTFDSYEYNADEYRITDNGYSVDKPSAKGKETVPVQDNDQQGDDQKDVDLAEGEDKSNDLKGDQRIVLEVENTVGEAVYYDLWDKDSGDKIAYNQIYRGGVDLVLGDNTQKKFKIKTYAISYGKRSAQAVYNINLYSNKHKVIVDYDGTEKERVYAEGSRVLMDRRVPKFRYFKEWKLILKDESGKEIADISDILYDSVNEFTADFVMPFVGDEYGAGQKYPAGYSLYLSEKCGDSVSKVTVPEDGTADKTLVPDPEHGLKEKTELSFTAGDKAWTPSGKYDISWSYAASDGDGSVPVTDTSVVYKDTVYTATITVPSDREKDIVFTEQPELVVPESFGGSITGSYITKDDSNDCITVVLTFKKTQDGKQRPDVPVKVVVRSYDMNKAEGQQEIQGAEKYYYVKAGSQATLMAPEYIKSAPDTAGLENEEFQKWVFDGSGLEPAEGYDVSDKTIKVNVASSVHANAVIKAEFYPVVTKIDAVLDPPCGGELIQMAGRNKPDEDDDTLTIKISNEYVIHKDNVRISWSPDPVGQEGGKTADFLTTYTATIGLKKNENGTIKVKKAGEDSFEEVNALFVFDDKVAATVNGETAECNDDAGTISYTFPVTTYDLKAVDMPEDIGDVEHGSGEDEIKAMLPKVVRIIIGGGIVTGAQADWRVKRGEQDDPRDEVTWTAEAKLTLPDGVDDRNGVLDKDGYVRKNNSEELRQVKITVNEADHSASPDATLESGTYLANQVTEIETNEEGGTTYYTLDGTDPSTSDTRKKYEGEEIYVSREDEENLVPDDGRMKMVLKAVTVKEGKWDSAVVTYEYIFDNEIPVPGGKNQIYDTQDQVGVYGSKFYTVEAVDSSGGVNHNGDAVGKNTGKYNATLKLVPGHNYVWKTDEEQPADSPLKSSAVYNPSTGSRISSAAENENAVLPDYKTTTEDQIVSFNIRPQSLKEAKITILSKTQTANGKPITPKIKVTLGEYTLTPDDYDAVYSDNVTAGKGKVKVRGKGNFTGESRVFTFDIKAKKYTIKYKLKGGKLGKKKGTVKKKYGAGKVIKLPKPKRKGYKFRYWKGKKKGKVKKYKAGKKFKVTKNMTFTAKWKRVR